MGNGKWIVEEASSGSCSDSDSDLGVTSIKSVTDVAGFFAGSRVDFDLS